MEDMSDVIVSLMERLSDMGAESLEFKHGYNGGFKKLVGTFTKPGQYIPLVELPFYVKAFKHNKYEVRWFHLNLNDASYFYSSIEEVLQKIRQIDPKTPRWSSVNPCFSVTG